MKRQFLERLFDGYGQHFDVDQVLFESDTEHQHLIIFENRAFGRVMALDGIIQTTERDEFIYHEMMIHVPVIAHGAARRVLIIGGGDGGSLREALKHPDVETVTQVEIDASVIDMSKTYLPGHSSGAFDHPKAKIVIDDGFRYVKECEENFDVIVCDSTDPVGPGEVLYSGEFYAACRRCLGKHGIMVGHTGVGWFQTAEALQVKERLRDSFASVNFYCAAVPTYVGGVMMFYFASDNAALARQPLEVIAKRFSARKLPTRYYNPEVHVGSFGVPQYFRDALDKGAPPPGPQWNAEMHEKLVRAKK
ncbi:MAG: polyamine aminopropyltransferase [Gammaproteobacteria bacterium]|nr:polyamine aminopropyltransferase [Gammaproteobacteria bacterium]MDH3412125.1 polyamine aminopropyltransferase [Gammaproteobacteria bacterium]